MLSSITEGKRKCTEPDEAAAKGPECQLRTHNSQDHQSQYVSRVLTTTTGKTKGQNVS